MANVWRPNYMLDGVNHMESVTAFLARWGDARGANQDLPLITTAFGNINQTGVAGDYTSPDLARTETRFYEGVEQGVRELVRLLVEGFGWTTYTSCQGHEYPGTSILPAERHVGMLPTSDQAYAHVTAVVRVLVATFTRRHKASRVRPYLYELTLTSNDGHYPVIDLVFRKSRTASWSEYFADLEPAYRATLEILSDLIGRRRSLLASGTDGAVSDDRPPRLVGSTT